MNYLIFGSSGFIGTHLAKYIETVDKKNCVLYKFDINKKVSADFDFVDVRQRIIFDINKPSDSIVYNLAAIHTTPGHLDYEYFETNIWGAENICKFARENDIRTIVFTSSIAPYGPSEKKRDENSIPMPDSPYGISKLSAEYIHKLWQAEDPNNRKLIIIRPGAVFGKSEQGNFTRLYTSIKKGIFFYPGRKHTKKACVYVKDVVRILYESSINELPGSIVLNLTYHPVPTIENICGIIADVTELKKPKIVMNKGLLKSVAVIMHCIGYVFNKRFYGIHPDRVKKLITSTNISGEKLNESPYKLQFSLEEAIKDWYNECDNQGLF